MSGRVQANSVGVAVVVELVGVAKARNGSGTDKSSKTSRKVTFDGAVGAITGRLKR